MSVTAIPPNAELDPLLAAEVERVRESGVLGQSGRLRELFDFLVSRSGDGPSPKEAEIALAVFGKSGSDALKDDPVARVYVHRLRRRLDDFYLRNGAPTDARLDIPKGEYRIVRVDPSAVTPAALAADVSDVQPAATLADAPAAPARRFPWKMAAAAAVGLLAANLAGWAIFGQNGTNAETALRKSPVWASLAKEDKRPLLVVVGDYYIFGEYQDRLFLKRLVRDFSINSKEDLTNHYLNSPDQYDRYSDVALGYLPTSAASALADLSPLLGGSDRPVQVSLASELTPDKLKSSDIIYVGLFSGLGALKDPVFSHSRFGIGESYDQIVDRESGESYTSEAFLAAPSDTMYRDFGYFARFQGPAGNSIVIIAGARDTALMGVADAVTRQAPLKSLEKATAGKPAFEALFEIKGQKHVNLESTILASASIDSQKIWSGAPSEHAAFPAE